MIREVVLYGEFRRKQSPCPKVPSLVLPVMSFPHSLSASRNQRDTLHISIYQGIST